MLFTQEELDKAHDILCFFSAKMKEKEPRAKNSIHILEEAELELPIEIDELNEYLN